MRRPCELVACVGLAGCNTVFGLEPAVPWDASTDDGRLPPDRDRDGIADREDPCIASINDFKGDFDADGKPSETDPCPVDYGSDDGDGDNIYDECDPLPQLGGDRRRCFMGFQNPTLTRELWVPRGDPSAWDLVTFSGIVATNAGTLVAQESFEAPGTTSYDVVVSAMNPAPEAAAALWLRTNDIAAPSDVGCEARGTSSSTQITIKGTEPPVTRSLPHAFTRLFRLQAVISPTAATGARNVRCIAKFTSTAFEQFDVSAELVLPPGRFAFAAEGARLYFAALLVLERDDVPPL